MIKWNTWTRKHAIRFSKTLLILLNALIFTFLIIFNIINPTSKNIIIYIILIIQIIITIYCWIAFTNCLKFFKKRKFEWGLRPGIVGLSLSMILNAFYIIINSSSNLIILNGISLIFLMFKDE